MTQEKLEQKAIQLLLGYGDEVSKLLLEQSHYLSIEKRTFTGQGFFTTFFVPEKAKVNNISKKYEGLSVAFKNGGLDEMCFMLYIDNGAIEVLEGFTFTPWVASDIQNIDFENFSGGGPSMFLK